MMLNAFDPPASPAIEARRTFLHTTNQIARMAGEAHEPCDINDLRLRIIGLATYSPHSAVTIARGILRDYATGFEALSIVLARYEQRLGAA